MIFYTIVTIYKYIVLKSLEEKEKQSTVATAPAAETNHPSVTLLQKFPPASYSSV